METLNLTDTELAEMKLFYQQELDKAQRRLQHVRNILDKLDNRGQTIQKEEEPAQPKAEQPEDSRELKEPKEKQNGQPTAPKTKKKRTQTWVSIVLNTFKEQDRPLQSREVSDIVLDTFEINEGEQRKTRKSVSYALKEQERTTKKVQSHNVDEVRAKYYGLSGWFDEQGQLKQEYIDKIEPSEQTSRPATTNKRNQKRGPKSVWANFVLRRLRQLDKPITYNELIDEALAFSKLPEDKRKSVKHSIISTTFKLRKRDKKIDTFSIGTREKYIALKRWFDKPGEIKPEYADKIEKPQRTTKYRTKPTKQTA